MKTCRCSSPHHCAETPIKQARIHVGTRNVSPEEGARVSEQQGGSGVQRDGQPRRHPHTEKLLAADTAQIKKKKVKAKKAEK